MLLEFLLFCVFFVVFTHTPALQVRYHEDFEKNKGSFTPTTSDLVTERVKRNTQDFSDISYRGIQRRVVEMERRRALEHDQETITGAFTTLAQSSPLFLNSFSSFGGVFCFFS